MTPAAIIQEATADGVRLFLTAAETIKAIGDRAAVIRWQGMLREHKTEIIEALKLGASYQGVILKKRELPVDIDQMIAEACQGQSISPDQLKAELEPGGDMPSLENGELIPGGLRITAEILSIMRYTETPEETYCDSVTCESCTHLQRTNHPHLGHCAKGEPEAIAGIWDSNRRYCGQYQAIQNEDE